jgi:hypothetical protein
MGQGKDRVNGSPIELRKAIAQARIDLVEHIRSLSDSTLPKNELGAKKMQTKKSASAHSKASTKSKSASKSDTGAKPLVKRKTSVTRKASGVATKAGHALDTMAAGAVVGAVKAAAQSLEENEAKSPKIRSSKTTSEVLSEMAPNAAVGAVAGAARAIVPQAEVKGKSANGKKRGE